MALDRAERGGELLPERHRQRLLQPRAARQRRALVRQRLGGERVGKPRQIDVDQRERLAQLQHQSGVERVLAGRAPMDVTLRIATVRSDRPGQRGNERNRQVAGASRGCGQCGEIVAVGATVAHDGVGGGLRDHAGHRLGPCQRRLEVEHALHARTVREDRGHRIGGELRIGHACQLRRGRPRRTGPPRRIPVPPCNCDAASRDRPS